jgi:hypothetical protein
MFDALADGEKVLQVGRLPDVDGMATGLRAANIIRRPGRAENHHRSCPKIGLQSEFMQHLPTVALGEVEIQKNQVRPPCAFVLSGPMDIFNGFLAVGDMTQFKLKAGFPEGLFDKEDIAPVIFDNQNLYWNRALL